MFQVVSRLFYSFIIHSCDDNVKYWLKCWIDRFRFKFILIHYYPVTIWVIIFFETNKHPTGQYCEEEWKKRLPCATVNSQIRQNINLTINWISYPHQQVFIFRDVFYNHTSFLPLLLPPLFLHQQFDLCIPCHSDSTAFRYTLIIKNP